MKCELITTSGVSTLQAFQIAEREFGIAPMMTGQELAMSEHPNKVTMVAYLSQFYEYFRRESIHPAKGKETCPPNSEGIPTSVFLER